MNCKICNISMFDKPLSRTNPTGQSDAGWMCQDCIKHKEPELYQNLSSDGSFKITNDIFDAVKESSLIHKVCEGEKCPICGASEIEAMTPRTTYACGSSDYDQRPNTFKQSNQCKPTK